MRRTIPLAVAVLAALVGLMVGVGIGQPITSHGGTPTDVFTQGFDGAVCSDDGDLMAQELTLDQQSHLLVYFTGEWKGLGVNEKGDLWFRLDGIDTDFDWNFPGHRDPESTVTVMWTFPDVAAGTHTVSAHSEVRPIPPRSAASASVRICAFTVFVMPVE